MEAGLLPYFTVSPGSCPCSLDASLDCELGPRSSDFGKLSSPEWGSQGSIWPGVIRVVTITQPHLWKISQRLQSLGKGTGAQAAPRAAAGHLLTSLIASPCLVRSGCNQVYSGPGHTQASPTHRSLDPSRVNLTHQALSIPRA